MKLYLLRHGTTDNNKDRIFQGRIDTPLNDDGLREAGEEGSLVRSEGITFSKIYCSPLIRALVTCEIVTGVPRSGFMIDGRLTEIAYGPYEGKPINDSDEGMWAFLKDPYRADPPSGVESLNAVEKRMKSAVAEILFQAEENDVILICSHGIALSSLFREYEQDGKKIMLEHGRLYISPVSEGRAGVPERVFA